MVACVVEKEDSVGRITNRRPIDLPPLCLSTFVFLVVKQPIAPHHCRCNGLWPDIQSFRFRIDMKTQLPFRSQCSHLRIDHARLRLLAAFFMATCSCATVNAEDVLSMGEIREEQRVFQSHLDTAEHDLSQAQRSFSSGTYNLAWVNVSNAGLELDKAKPKMEGHPQRIATSSVFFGATRRREEARDAFYQIRDHFYDINRKVIALEIDVGAKLGIDIPYLRQLREAISLMLPHIKDPAVRAQLEALLAQMDDAIRSGDVNRVKQLLQRSEDLIKQAMDADPSLRGLLPGETLQSLQEGGSEKGKAAAANATDNAADDVGSATNAARQAAASAANGEDAAEAQAARAAAEAARRQQQAAQQTPATFTGEVEVDGIVIDFRGGKGVEAEYIGERGARLVREKEKVLRSLDPIQVADGAVRDWNLRLMPVPGSIQQSATNYAARLKVADPANEGAYAIAVWRVLDETGKVVQDSRDGSTEFALDLTSSGNYTVEAHGETDWGSTFILRQVLNISL
jgi:hypothetical protein